MDSRVLRADPQCGLKSGCGALEVLPPAQGDTEVVVSVYVFRIGLSSHPKSSRLLLVAPLFRETQSLGHQPRRELCLTGLSDPQGAQKQQQEHHHV